MILKKLRIQNFRSYGNNINEIDFEKDSGNLILLMGKNANGKSSISLALDFVLFGEVRNNNKKLKLSSLPNRFNGNLMVELFFESNNSSIRIKRKLNPNDFEVEIDGIIYNNPQQSKLDKYIDFDIESWKSFISMSIDEFKNFLTLKVSDKKLILEKLLCLEIIDKVSAILKDKRKQFLYDNELYKSEIKSYNETLNDIKKNVEKIVSNNTLNISNEIILLKNSVFSKKDEFEELNKKIIIFYDKDTILKNEIKELDNKKLEIIFNLKHIEEKIKLFNNDKCPMCESDFKNNHVHSQTLELKTQSVNYNNLLDTINLDLKNLNDKYNKLKNITDSTNNQLNILKNYLNETKNKISVLLNTKIESDDNILILNQTIDTINSKINVSSSKLNNTTKISNLYDDVIKIISDNNIKRNIVSKIIIPINKFIKENLEALNINFLIELNNEFNINITSYGEEIDCESLSTSETKKSNIAIMMAYLKLIRSKKYINILFLDEVFSSVDIEGIENVLIG